jgi:hypothetical protein
MPFVAGFLSAIAVGSLDILGNLVGGAVARVSNPDGADRVWRAFPAKFGRVDIFALPFDQHPSTASLRSGRE